jgi:hypothetical protein
VLTRTETAAESARGEPDAPAVRLDLPDPARLIELLGSAPSPLARVRHAIHARRLAGAESFTELLSLARLVGVERHGYQIETVHRVLRTLRGRALLSDEVGLGKTIEALMVLVEYQLRGMARRVLVLAPPALPSMEPCASCWSRSLPTSCGPRWWPAPPRPGRSRQHRMHWRSPASRPRAISRAHRGPWRSPRPTSCASYAASSLLAEARRSAVASSPVIGDNGSRYELFVRDLIPLEDAGGLLHVD